MIYKERYEIQKVKSPEDVKKSFYVRHLIPKDGGTYLAIGEIRYFETLEAAERYKDEKENRKGGGNNADSRTIEHGTE